MSGSQFDRVGGDTSTQPLIEFIQRRKQEVIPLPPTLVAYGSGHAAHLRKHFPGCIVVIDRSS